MAVIAMTREMGTRGKDVAAELADRLGLEVVHHELVERHVAERMSVAESTVHRFLEGDASLWERWNVDQRRLYHFTAVEILELAQKGNVIIRGWGAAQLLSEVPHVICARICAPMSYRLAEMRRRLKIDDDDAEIARETDRGDATALRREIDRSDSAHDQAVRAHFNRDWRDPAGYNVVLNTAMTPVGVCADILAGMVGLDVFQQTEESRATLNDKLTLARVRGVIDENAQQTLGGGLELSISKGVVTVSGITLTGAVDASMINAIKSVEGVVAVEDDIRLMPSTYTV